MTQKKIKKHFKSMALLVVAGASFSAPTFARADLLFQSPDGNAVVTLIQAAQSTIDIEIYTMSDPLVQAALTHAMDRGVRLRVIQEPSPVESTCAIFGSPAPKEPSYCAEDRNFVQQVISRGGQYVPFNKDLCGTGYTNCFEHGKMLTTDGTTALISSGNFDASNLCDSSVGIKQCDRDYDYVTTDPGTISVLEQIFEADLAGIPYDLPTLLAQPQANNLTVSPFSLQPLVNFINIATTSIQIEEQYLWQTDINQAIVNAAHRGVRVEVQVESACAYGKPSSSVEHEFTSTFSAMEQAGVAVRMFTKNNLIGGKPGYLHAKAIVVDGNKAWVGSINGSDTATQGNREFGYFFTDPTLVQQLSADLENDFNDSGSETWQDSLNCAEKNK